MKKFQLTILIGKKIIYQSILVFTPEQETTYIDKLVLMSKNDEDFLKDELNVSFERTSLKKKPKLKFDLQEWGKMSIEEIAEKFPDVLICAGIQETIYGIGLFNGFSNFELKISEDITEENTISELGNYSWKCIPLKE